MFITQPLKRPDNYHKTGKTLTSIQCSIIAQTYKVQKTAINFLLMDEAMTFQENRTPMLLFFGEKQTKFASCLNDFQKITDQLRNKIVNCFLNFFSFFFFLSSQYSQTVTFRFFLFPSGLNCMNYRTQALIFKFQ